MQKETQRRAKWLTAIGGALAGCALSIALVAGYALILQRQWLDIDTAAAANTVIKLLCAAFAAWLAVLKRESRLPLWGGLGGALYMTIASLVFMLISGEASFGINTLADIGMCFICGAVVGMLRNLRRG